MELLKLGNVFNSLQYKYLLLIYYIVDHQDKNKNQGALHHVTIQRSWTFVCKTLRIKSEYYFVKINHILTFLLNLV